MYWNNMNKNWIDGNALRNRLLSFYPLNDILIVINWPWIFIELIEHSTHLQFSTETNLVTSKYGRSISNKLLWMQQFVPTLTRSFFRDGKKIEYILHGRMLSLVLTWIIYECIVKNSALWAELFGNKMQDDEMMKQTKRKSREKVLCK